MNELQLNLHDPKKHWTTILGQAAGHPAAFGIVLAYALLWLIFDRPHFEFSAVATLAVWMMTLFIQRSNRRDTLALHAKLDELLRVHDDARSELTRLDEREPEEIEQHRDAEVRKNAIGHVKPAVRNPNVVQAGRDGF